MLKHFVLPQSISRILRCARMHVGALPYLRHSHINTQPVFSFVDSLSISCDANCQIVISQWSIHCQIQLHKQNNHSYKCAVFNNWEIFSFKSSHSNLHFDQFDYLKLILSCKKTTLKIIQCISQNINLNKAPPFSLRIEFWSRSTSWHKLYVHIVLALRTHVRINAHMHTKPLIPTWFGIMVLAFIYCKFSF